MLFVKQYRNDDENNYTVWKFTRLHLLALE